jgi:hypothetical protein
VLGNHGTVAEGDEHGFIRDAAGFHGVDYPGSQTTDVHTGDGAGTFVGDWLGDDGKVHGFLLTDGSFTAFDVPGPFWATSPRGITRDGIIVGTVGNARTFLDRGFIKQGNHYRLIDYPAAVSTDFVRINNHGVIVGFYTDADGGSHGLILRTCLGGN